MSSIPTSDPLAFLDHADPDRLARAMTLNLTRWLTRGARAGGGTISHHRGVTAAYTPWAGGGGTIILRTPHAGFGAARPELVEGSRDDPDSSESNLTAALTWLRARSPARGIRLWRVNPTAAPLPGAQTILQDPWMSRSLADLPKPDDTAHVTLAPLDDDALWDAFPHPYHTGPAARDAAARMHRAAARRPRRIHHLAAFIDGYPVGHGTLNLTTGPLGVAGLYDIGVLPTARNRGIGRALTTALLHLARQRGALHAVLIATELGAPVYRRLGFEPRGTVRTDQLPAPG